MDRRTFFKAALVVLPSLVGLLSSSLWFFLRQTKFGATPTDARLDRIRRSPNFRNGQFQNQIPTPVMTSQDNPLKSMLKFAFNRSKRLKPSGPIPSVRADLLHLDPARQHFVWFGHSSYFLQLDGKRILVDPVLSGRASPVSFTTKAFPGTDPYTVDDLPPIDYLFITHDHWDHLDYETVTRLRPKVKKVICPLGVGAHFERWGYQPNQIEEGDWGDKIALADGFQAHVLPARHFSGRALQRNLSLWASFALQSASGYKVFIGGDGGYGPHFAQMGKQFDGFDLALLENGQYDQGWKYIHMMPDQTLQAGVDLQARLIIPVHNSKFCISNHDWDAPLTSITAIVASQPPRLLTPILGSVVEIGDPPSSTNSWWKSVT